MTPRNPVILRTPGASRGRGRGDVRSGGQQRPAKTQTPFIPTLGASSARRSFVATDATENSSTPGSATARAIRDLVEASPFDASDWLMHELTQFNVKINRTSFPIESSEIIFTALDDVFKLAVSIPQEYPLAFSAYTAFILFPRLILRSLPPGCQGKHASPTFKTRCDMLMEGKVSEMIRDAHDSQVKRVVHRIHAVTQPSPKFPLTTRAAALARCGAVGKACKLAFSYCTESDPVVATNFLSKLATATLRTHVLVPPSTCKSAFFPVPLKTCTDAFTLIP